MVRLQKCNIFQLLEEANLSHATQTTSHQPAHDSWTSTPSWETLSELKVKFGSECLLTFAISSQVSRQNLHWQPNPIFWPLNGVVAKNRSDALELSFTSFLRAVRKPHIWKDPCTETSLPAASPRCLQLTWSAVLAQTDIRPLGAIIRLADQESCYRTLSGVDTDTPKARGFFFLKKKGMQQRCQTIWFALE